MEDFQRLSRLEIGGLIGVVALLSVMLLALIFNLAPSSLFSPPSAAPTGQTGSSQAAPENRHSGTIVMGSTSDGKCRLVQFDNDTGSMKQLAPGECPNEPVLGVNSTQGRMNAVRDAFQKR
jgi:hypothetical protein